MSEKLKIGIAGAGVFGGYHAQKYAEHPKSAVSAVYDLQLDRADALAARVGAASFDDYSSFLNRCEAVVITTPAVTHFELAKIALETGKDIFVEKPLATCAADAAALCDLADQQDLIIQVGHQERYVLQSAGLMDFSEAPRSLRFERCSQPSDRCRDVSVVLDLMVHDIDLACAILEQDECEVLDASGSIDRVETEIEFANGARVAFLADRTAGAVGRKVTADFADGKVEFDFLTRDVKNTLGRDFQTKAALASCGDLNDPLGFGAEQFISALLSREAPAISGHDGARAVAIGRKIEASLELNNRGSTGEPHKVAETV